MEVVPFSFWCRLHFFVGETLLVSRRKPQKVKWDSAVLKVRSLCNLLYARILHFHFSGWKWGAILFIAKAKL